MKSMKNERGSVLVFATLMIVLLLVMVGIGLDTGWITYVRGLGQPAVDAAALAGASAVPTQNPFEVNSRVATFNLTNDFVNSKSATAQIQNDGKNVTYIYWNFATGDISQVGGIRSANGVRVALEQTNPYDGVSKNTAINAPLFLTPLFNVLGISTAKTTNINVSAVAVIQRIPGIPIVIAGCPPPGACESVSTAADGTLTGKKCKLAQSPSTNNSGWTSYAMKSANAKAFKEMVDEPTTCSGKIPAVDVGANICLQNGVDDSVLTELYSFYNSNIDNLVGSDPSATPHVADCALIPVVDARVTDFTKCDVPIISFAKLCIRDVITTGSPKYVYGDITCNRSVYDTIENASTKNCYIPRLVRDKKSGM